MTPSLVSVSPLRFTVIGLSDDSVNEALTVVPAVLKVETGPPFRLSVAEVAEPPSWNNKEPVPAVLDFTVMALPSDVDMVAVPLTVKTGLIITNGGSWVIEAFRTCDRPLLNVIPVVVSVDMN